MSFVREAPLEREPILRLMQEAANATPSGSKVLDAGAGQQPYKELFGHCEYVAQDWSGSLYGADELADIVAPIENLPVEDGAFDAVLCTQVLEHVAEPAQSLRELARVLRPEGTLWLSVPLAWPLHEQPYDFFRYTNHGIAHLLDGAGFVDVDVRPRNRYFSTIATLLTAAPPALEWGWTPREKLGRWLVIGLAAAIRRMDPLDRVQTFPLGFACRARRA